MGCSRSWFEGELERQYNQEFTKAKRQIDNDEYPNYSWIQPYVYGYLDNDFPSYEATQMVNDWNRKLANAIDVYQSECNHRKAVEEADRKKIRLQKEAIAREQEERKRAEKARQREEKERHRKQQRDSSLDKLTSSPYNFEESLAEAFIDEDGNIIEKKLSAYQSTIKNTKLLMSSPYYMSEEEAKKYICKDGEINKVALTQFENARKNKELIAKKIAEWEAQKAKQTEVTNNNFVCPSCGHPSEINDKFCRICGAAIQKQCPSCKKLLPASCKFCSACGTKL